ncbi:MAG: uridine kinase [Bacteroidetes bacterium]|nr:uridine kinase [Bacteroidota bacterium]
MADKTTIRQFRDGCIVIGVAGGSGSGKTTLCHRIVDRMGDDRVLLFQHDAYYHDLARMPVPDPARINYDHPDSLETDLCAAQLADLRRGHSVAQPVYDFSTHRRTAETRLLEPHPVILVEGILVLAEPALREHMDLKIFVDADADVCILRRMERDISERGRTLASVRDQYYHTVRPSFEQFVAPSKRHADIIIPHGGENDAAVAVIAAYIERSASPRAM